MNQLTKREYRRPSAENEKEKIPEPKGGLESRIFDLEVLIRDRLESLPQLIAEEVANSVVGESYYRYDSSSTYFPTLIFVFRETNTLQYRRKSQVKARLRMDNKTITDDVIVNIRKRCNAIRGLTYVYGSVRANFVSTDKRWKTTLYTYDQENAVNLLKSICQVVEEPFSNRNISWTIGRGRTNPYRRDEPLQGIEPTPSDAGLRTTMRLFRIVLQVNGIPRPITILRESN